MKKSSVKSTNEPNDMNLVKLVEQFANEDKAREHLIEVRWPEGVTCTRCESKSVTPIKGRPQFNCNGCHYQFSVTSGTIFNDSHLPLWKWFLAIYLMTEAKKGISACQMQRTLAVSYRTAWYLCHRIRAAMKDASGELLRGIVEVDETFIGGKVRGMGKGYRGNKSIAVGAVQRGGQIRLEVIESTSRNDLHDFIAKNTADDTEAIYTDEWPAYKGITEASDIPHHTVNHKAHEWVHGDVHTNGIESVWSLLKRSIVGSYHKVSKKHLDAYLSELEHRFNNRNNKFLFRDTLLKLVKSGNLKYSELTKAA